MMRFRFTAVISTFLTIIVLLILGDFIDFRAQKVVIQMPARIMPHGELPKVVKRIKAVIVKDEGDEGNRSIPRKYKLLLPPDLRPFSRYILTERERQVFLATLKSFDEVWRIRLRKPYFLAYGSLLGVVRHGGIVPFDDDIDLTIRKIDYDRLYELLNDTGLKVKGRSPELAKVYLDDHNLTRPIKGHIHRWPFMDIFYYEIRNGRVFQTGGASKSEVRDYLPPVMLPFEGIMFPVARCPWKHWRKLYGSGCRINGYRHSEEKRLVKADYKSVCKSFREAFPYAVWMRVNETHVYRIMQFPELNDKGKRVIRSTKTLLYLPKCGRSYL